MISTIRRFRTTAHNGRCVTRLSRSRFLVKVQRRVYFNQFWEELGQGQNNRGQTFHTKIPHHISALPIIIFPTRSELLLQSGSSFTNVIHVSFWTSWVKAYTIWLIRSQAHTQGFDLDIKIPTTIFQADEGDGNVGYVAKPTHKVSI